SPASYTRRSRAIPARDADTVRVREAGDRRATMTACCRPGCASSESEHEANRPAREVEIARSVFELDAEHVQRFEGSEVANVTSDAGVRAEEQHHPAAKVPADLVLVEVFPIQLERITLGANESNASQSVGPNAEASLPAEWNTDEHVAECGQDAAVAEVRFAEEVRAVAEISLDTDHTGAHPPEARAPVKAARINRVAKLTFGIAAEVPSDERNE